ncbi:MAG: HEAT repeat domain-containing protein, partial [Deltaproteobacteria bacterium]
MDRCKKVMIAFGILLSVISAQGASCWAGQPPKPYGKILVSTMIVDALGKIGDPKCVKSIIEVLKSNEFFIKSYAARALGRLGDKEAMPALKNAVVNDKNYLVQITAA